MKAGADAPDNVEVAAAKKAIGLGTPGELVRTQEIPRGDLMGQCDRVFRRKMPAVRHKTVASAPSLPWNSLTADALYGFHNVCLSDERWDHVLFVSRWDK